MKLIIEPKDHEALAAAEKLRSYCNSLDSCKCCIFSNKNGCVLTDEAPDDWDLTRIYDRMAEGGH